MGKIIDRYILREITSLFFLSLFIMTFLLLLGKILQLADLIVNKGVGIANIAWLILYLMPSFLLFTIPVSLLVSILVGMGRLASDNEITVLKGAGVSIYRLLYPVAAASVVAFLIAASLSLFFVPRSNGAVRNLLFDVIRQNASVNIRERVFNDNFKGLLLYADNIPAHGRYMEGVIISDNRISSEPSTIFAEKAYLISDSEYRTISLRLEKGSTHSIDLKRKYYRKMDFSSYDINLDMETAIVERNHAKTKDSTEMTPGELLEKIRTPGLEETSRREFMVEFNKKFTFPFTCIVFGLLGGPIGVSIRRSARSRGFTFGIIIVLLYYLLQLGGTALMETGRISPWIGSWFPGAMFFLAGIYLLVAAAKENLPGWEALRRLSQRIALLRKLGK